jgi:Flp pilus assembly protein CpaB
VEPTFQHRRRAFVGAAFAVAWFGVCVLIDQQRQRQLVPPRPHAASIVVAAADLPRGTVIQPRHLRLAEWPVARLPPGALRDLRAVTGRVLKVGVKGSEPLVSGGLWCPERDGNFPCLTCDPTGQHHTVNVRVEGLSPARPRIKWGDLVDVVWTPAGANGKRAARTIARGVKVHVVGDEHIFATWQVREDDGTTAVQLLVDVEQLVWIEQAASRGRIRLVKHALDAQRAE